jgi:ribonuclease HII
LYPSIWYRLVSPNHSERASDSEVTLLIGTDEAGYGPNLGPLLISATTWRVPDDGAALDLYDHLRHIIRADASSNCHIPIADSKQLYKPGGGLLNLERGLFAALSSREAKVDRWRDAWHALAPTDAEQWQCVPWYSDYNMPLPIDLDDGRRSADTMLWAEGLNSANISLEGIRSTALFPERFNALVDRYDSKGAVLSLATLELVRDALQQHDDSHVLIQCDKHGGRNRYFAILQTVFPDERFQIVRESRDASVYRWDRPGRPIEIRFVAKGESFLPAALASMTSKYLRELAMKAFNAFWQQHLPKLKPTAGYPVDAKRFKAEIEAVRQKLRVDERMLWRVR